MYICNNCGEVFDTPETYEEHHPYGTGYASEKWSVCPNCGEPDYDEAKQCERCGEFVAELDGDGLCDVCYGDMHGK
jgi:rubrerythrin